MEKNYLSTSELAKLLGISRIAVFRKIKAGKIKAQKMGRNFAISKDDLSGILNINLTQEGKDLIKKSVQKTVEEYGETLRQLGKE